MAKQADRRRKTNRKLLISANRLFEKKGFDATTVDEIVSDADLAKGTFYQHFDSKVDVLIVLAREQFMQWVPAQISSLEAGKPALEVLRSFLRGICKWFEANRSFADAALWQMLRRAAIWDDLLPETTSGRFLETVFNHARLAGTIRDDMSAHDLARIWSGLLFGVVLAWARDEEATPLYPVAEQAMTIFLKGASAGAEGP